MEKILIHSYKGGTGKTTVAINLASTFSHDNKVLLIENDFSMPSFYNIFKHEPEYFFNDYLNDRVNFKKIIAPEVRPNLDVIFANKNFDPSEKITGSDQEWFLELLKRLMKEFRTIENDYSYVIFDTPPGWHMILVTLITLSDKAILILRPNTYEVLGTKRLIEILYKRAKPMLSLDIYLLFNQVPEVDMSKDLEQWAGDLHEGGITYAGFIPCSCDTSYEMAHERNIFPFDHLFNKSLKQVIETLHSKT